MKSLLIALAFVFTITGVSAQQNLTAEWGDNPDERQQNALIFNYYKDAYDNKNYDLALQYLDQLLDKCPKARVNIYVWGTNIYKNKIARAQAAADRATSSAYIDSLMMLYDKRLECFADHAKYGTAYTLKAKAKDYYNFRKNDVKGVIDIFQKAIDANKDDEDATFLTQYFMILTDDYIASEVETDFYLNEYERIGEMVKQLGEQQAMDDIDQLLVNSKAADCDNLEKIYSARLSDPSQDEANKDQLGKAFTLLSSNKCRTAFYFNIGERYLKLNPSSGTAMLLATAYEEAGNTVKSIEYLKTAVENEPDPITKAQLCVQIAGNELNANNARAAAEFARQAISYNSENGFAYICLAQAYAVGSNGCSDKVARGAVFWLAYDTIQSARRIFADDAEQLAKVQSIASSYAGNFPSKEDCFFHGLTVAGQSYNVSCGWVSGRTSVKW